MNSLKNFKKLKCLGQGCYSKVFLVEGEQKKLFIVKECIYRKYHHWLNDCRKEAAITQKLNNPAYRVGKIYVELLNHKCFVWGEK